MQQTPPSAFSLTHRAVTASTMADVRAAALAGAADGTVVYADVQTGGYGRRGRSWQSPPGNLYASLLVRSALTPAACGLFGLVAALAVARALPDAVAHARVRLKWPNDVVVDGAKIAGILLETIAAPADSVPAPAETLLTIGVGLNIAQHPLDTPYPATSLAQLGLDPTAYPPVLVLQRFLAAFADYRTVLEQAGAAALSQLWLERAAHAVGDPLVVRLPDAELAGTFAGLDENGCLRLRLPQGILRTIAVGEVFFRTGSE
jgi:BirA family transcriptional regulator, biotin operon repressor / biotin---[acetyl-CoA-carboxylase] ligase